MEIIELTKLQEEGTQELEVYRAQSVSVGEEAQMIARSIQDAATAEAAAQWCAAKLGWCDQIKTGWLGKMRDLWHRGHRETCDKINTYTAPVEAAVAQVKAGIRVWRAQETKRVADEQARLLAEARRKDEEDRLKVAEKLEAEGNKTMADAVLAQAGNFVAPVVTMEKSKVHSGRMVWKVRIDPLKKGELLKMIADRADLHAFVIIDEKRIEKQAGLMTGNLNWPGVTCYQEEQIAINRNRGGC